MKKLFAFVLALAIVFSLFGCSAGANLEAEKEKAYDKGYEEGYAAAMEDIEYNMPSYILGRYIFNFLDENNFFKLYITNDNDKLLFETALDYFSGEASREDAVAAIISIWTVCDNLLEEATGYIEDTAEYLEDKY